MNEPLPQDEDRDLSAGDEEAFRLAQELVALGEGKAAIDMLRKKVNLARKAPPAGTLMRLRLLSQYAGILESIDALAEAEFIRAEALGIAESGFVTPEDALEAYLGHGLLLVKMQKYDVAVAKLQEAVRRAEALESLGNLQQQIIIAQAWKGQAEAFEALGEL